MAGPNPTLDIFGQLFSSSAIPWDATFGNPAGSVRTLDPYGWTYLSAPAGYLGNQSARYGESFSADIFIRVTDGRPYPILGLIAPDMPVPEPGAAALLAGALAGASLVRRGPSRS